MCDIRGLAKLAINGGRWVACRQGGMGRGIRQPTEGQVK